MIEHQQQTEQNSFTGSRSIADQERVTAEEFSAALSSLEQRKAAQAAHLADTVEIGPTVRELGIDASPEEIYREVLAQRSVNAPSQESTVPPPNFSAQKRDNAAVVAERERATAEAKAALLAAANEAVKGLAAAAVVAQSHIQEATENYRQKAAVGRPTVYDARSQRATLQQVQRAQRDAMRQARRAAKRSSLWGPIRFLVFLALWCGAFVAIDNAPLQVRTEIGADLSSLMNHGVHMQVNDQRVDLGPTSVQVEPMWPSNDVTFGTLQPGQTAYASTDQILHIVKAGGGVDSQTKTLPISSTDFANSWSVMDHDGKLYIQAYALTLNLDSFEHGRQTLYNTLGSTAAAGPQMSRVVVPLLGAKLGASSSQSDNYSLTLDSFKPDDFTQDDN